MCSLVKMIWYDSFNTIADIEHKKLENNYVLILHTHNEHVFKLSCFEHAEWEFPVSYTFEF